MNNRLQFRHHDPIFDTREEAIEYIYSQIRFADDGLAFENKSYGFSLFAEPTVLRYKNENDDTNPHIIIAVGATTNEGTQYNDNRFCIIDIDNTESEIQDLWEELEKAIESLTVIVRDTNTLKLYSEKTDSGTVISGDVVVATSQIFDDIRRPNVILNTDDGLFTYVNMDYDPENDKLTFTINGETKEWDVNNFYVTRGYYSKRDESLHLVRNDGTDITVNLENLIDEWGVEGDASNTPIVLTKETVGYGEGDDSSHNHVEPWQDVLRGDVRLADRRYNILKKTSDGRYLYVDGLANNIAFFYDGQELTVQEALSNAIKDTSNDSTNIIYEKADGYYATATLKYTTSENKLTFTTSNVSGGTTVEEIKLNSVELFKNVIYNPLTETLIITYVDSNGNIQECDIPIGQMITDWEWDIENEGHNVKLHKRRVVAGNDKVSADAAIYGSEDNILIDKNHELYVKGTADNIKYRRDTTVEAEIDGIKAKNDEQDASISSIQSDVETISASVESKLSDLINEDHSIDVNKDNANEPKIKVNLSTEIEDGKPNIIKLNSDGLYAGVDLDYDFESGTGKNVLIFKTTNGTKTFDLKTDVSSHEDNILINDNGALYVSGSQIEENKNNIAELIGDVDVLRAAESALTNSLNVETIARQNADNAIETSVNTEIERARNAESQLQTNIDSEAATRNTEDTRIEGKLDSEIARSTAKDDDLQSQVSAEVLSRTELGVRLDAEKEAREAEDERIWSKVRPIEFKDTTTVHNERLRSSGETPDEVRHNVLVSNASDNIINIDNTLTGLYATAKLGYNESANLLTIYGPNDAVLNSVTLGPGSLIKDISYDYAEKSLVITYRRAGDSEDTVMKFPVADLFNEWDVQNLSEGSALELTKHSQATETGTVDILTGKVLLTHAVELGDGTVDYGDNIIRIVNNGLYASGSAITEAMNVADCAKNELREVEIAVLGQIVSKECGSGYTYRPKTSSSFISAATDMYDADVLLDRAISDVANGFNCTNDELKKVEDVLGVFGNCDRTITYPKTEGCLLTSAETFSEADAILESAICSIRKMLLGSETPTATLKVVEEGLNSYVNVDVRLSHGNDMGMWQDDDELVIKNFSGDCIELIDGSCTQSEFTDTNVLRIVDLREIGFVPEYKSNGLYLSNVWDCGQYTSNGEGTPYNRYKIDNSPQASNIFQNKYKNQVRYENGN